MSDRPLILIADDESKIRRLLASNLEFEGFDVVCAGDGEQALEVFEKAVEKPEAIVLDIMMPGVDGLEVLKRIRKTSSVPVVLLSAKDEKPTVLEGFREGADDFVPKPFYMEELVARLRAVLRRSRHEEKRTEICELVNGSLRINPVKCQCWVNENPVKLTSTEFKLLLEMIKRPGEVLTHERLLRLVWGEEYIGEVQYLRVAFTRIRRKLEEAGLESGVIVAYSSVGYILADLRPGAE